MINQCETNRPCVRVTFRDQIKDIEMEAYNRHGRDEKYVQTLTRKHEENMTALWDAAPCGLAEEDRRLSAYCDRPDGEGSTHL
jgi:hypothetical protein